MMIVCKNFSADVSTYTGFMIFWVLHINNGYDLMKNLHCVAQKILLNIQKLLFVLDRQAFHIFLVCENLRIPILNFLPVLFPTIAS